MVDGGQIILVKGTSGSGKSTRTYYFLSFLESIGVKFTPFRFVNIVGEEHEIGVLAEDIGIVFVGKFYETGGCRRWQGFDSVTKRLHRQDGLCYFIKKMVGQGLCPYIEGAGTTSTWRLRPYYLCGDLGVTNILHILYHYNHDSEFSAYKQRIIGRSGPDAKGEAMWNKNKTFIKEFLKAQPEAEDLNSVGGNAVLIGRPYDAPIYDAGAQILDWFGLSDIVPQFREYCINNNDYLQKNSFANYGGV